MTSIMMSVTRVLLLCVACVGGVASCGIANAITQEDTVDDCDSNVGCSCSGGGCACIPDLNCRCASTDCNAFNTGDSTDACSGPGCACDGDTCTCEGDRPECTLVRG